MKLATARYLFLIFLFSILTAFGQTPYDLIKLEKPPQKLVQDYAQIFDAKQLNDLESKLVAYDDSTSTQILVLTVKSLDGYPLETFANDIGEKWGVGTKGKDNGVVIVLSEKDRKITIRTGYSAQIYLPPSVNKSIIDNVIIPYFKQGDFAGGINAGVDNIFKAFAGEYKNDKPKSKNNIDALVLFFVIAFFIFIFVIASRGGGGNNGGNRGRRRSILDDIIIMNTGSTIFGSGGFGSGSSSGGGGFGGFGGGSFGGGGASGSW